MEKYIDWVISYIGLLVFFIPMTAVLGSLIYLGNEAGWYNINLGTYISVTFIVISIMSMFIEVEFEDV